MSGYVVIGERLVNERGRQMRIWLGRGLAIFFGLGLFWLGGEVVVRVLFHYQVNYDLEMWKYARQLKVSSSVPGLAFEHRPNRKTHLMGVDVSINSSGLRGPEVSKAKPPDTVRVAVLGDSITFGWGVEEEATYPRLLEKRLKKELAPLTGCRYQVLNFGVGNYNSTDESRVLAEKVWQFDPDLVLLGYFINDVEIHPRTATMGPLQYSAFAVWLWGRMDSLLRRLGDRPDYRNYYQRLYAEDAQGLAAARYAWQQMNLQARQHGVPFVVALLPELHILNPYPFAAIHGRMKEEFGAFGWKVVDLTDALPTTDAEGYWVAPDDAHPNAEAMTFFADHLWKTLDWQKLFSSRHCR